MARTWVPECPPLLERHKGQKKSQDDLDTLYRLFCEAQGDLDKTTDPDDAYDYIIEMEHYSGCIKRLTGVKL